MLNSLKNMRHQVSTAKNVIHFSAVHALFSKFQQGQEDTSEDEIS